MPSAQLKFAGTSSGSPSTGAWYCCQLREWRGDSCCARLCRAPTEPASLRTLFDEDRAAGSSQEKRGGNESRDAAAAAAAAAKSEPAGNDEGGSSSELRVVASAKTVRPSSDKPRLTLGRPLGDFFLAWPARRSGGGGGGRAGA